MLFCLGLPICVFQTGQFEFLEVAAYSWLRKVRASNVSVSVALFKEKVLNIAAKVVSDYEDANEDVKKRLKIDELREFKAERGWWDKFKRRWGLHCNVAEGEAASVDLKVVLGGMEDLKTVLEEYDSSDCFNLDEAALFYRMMPERTIMLKPNEKGIKKSKVVT